MSPRGRRLIPAYLATQGRQGSSTERRPDRTAVLHRTEDRQLEADGSFTDEHRRLWQLLEPGALAVAEAAAHLRLPVSVVWWIVSDLSGAGLLTVSASPQVHHSGARADPVLIGRVLDALRAIR